MNSNDFSKEKIKFGKNIAKLRNEMPSFEYENKTISQQELSDRSGNFTKKHLGQIERGQGNPSFEIILAIAAVLEVHPKELFKF